MLHAYFVGVSCLQNYAITLQAYRYANIYYYIYKTDCVLIYNSQDIIRQIAF